MQEEKEFQQRIQKIEGLVRTVETLADEEAKATAQELVRSLMDLHGAGLERLLEVVWESGEGGQSLIDKFGRDDLIGSLLLLYGLHPLDLETRVVEALDKLRPHVLSEGGAVELLAVRDGLIRVRLEVKSGGCGSSGQGLKLAVEEAIYGAAPDLAALEIEEVAEQRAASGFVPLAMLRNATEGRK